MGTRVRGTPGLLKTIRCRRSGSGRRQLFQTGESHDFAIIGQRLGQGQGYPISFFQQLKGGRRKQVICSDNIPGFRMEKLAAVSGARDGSCHCSSFRATLGGVRTAGLNDQNEMKNGCVFSRLAVAVLRLLQVTAAIHR